MHYSRRLFVLLALILIVSSAQLSAQTLPMVTPEDVGLSSERLARIGTVAKQYVEDSRLAGIVTLVARHGKIAHFASYGMMDREKNIPMRNDALFRICSMSKPITTVAVMMLYEEGRFLLSDPVSKYIPEFRDMKVLRPESPETNTAKPETVPARSQITILNLLTHTSGLTYQWDRRLGQMYFDAGVSHGIVQHDFTTGEGIKALAGLPLLHEPGERFTYSLSDDVLGYLVEVVSGMMFDEFLRERIFEPLGMKDTYFFLPKEKVSRLATVYTYYQGRGLERFPDEPIVEGGFVYSADYPYNGPRKYFSGGGGLCTSMEDYLRFCQMMLNGGELDGVRILSRKSVELIQTDQVGELIDGQGYGLGFGVTSETSHLRDLGTIGAYYWGGFFYTTFFIDPVEDMIAISMAQLHPAGDVDWNAKFKVLAYQSIAD